MATASRAPLQFRLARAAGVVGGAVATAIWWLRPLAYRRAADASVLGIIDVQRMSLGDMLFVALTCVAGLCLLARAADDRLLPHPPRVIWIPLALFAFVVSLSAIASIHVFHSLHGAALVAEWMTLFLIAASLGRVQRWRRPTQIGMFAAAFAIACLAVAQRWVAAKALARAPETDVLPRVFGTFASPGLYGGFLLLLVFWQLGVADAHFAKKRERGRAALFALGTSASAIALLLTRSRAAWLAGGVALLVYAGMTRGRKAFALGGVLLACAALGVGMLRPNLLRTDTLVARTSYWRATIGMIAKRPLVGTGIGTWGDAYPTTMLPAGYPTVTAHNDWLQRCAETGVAGGLAFAAFAIGVLRVGARGWRRAADPSTRRTIAGLWCAVLALYIDACLDFPLHDTQVATVAALVMGLLVAEGWGRVRPLPLADWGWFRTVGALCAALIVFGWLGRQAAGRLYLQGALLAARDNQSEAFEANCLRADAWLPLDPEPSSLLAAWRLRQGERSAYPLSSYRDAARLAEVAVVLAPWHPWYADRAGVAYWRLADTTGDAGQRQRAIDFFQLAALHFPAHPGFQERLADVLQYVGSTDATAAFARAERSRRQWRTDSAIAGPMPFVVSRRTL